MALLLPFAPCNRLCSCDESCEPGSCAPGSGPESWCRSDRSLVAGAPPRPGKLLPPLRAADPSPVLSPPGISNEPAPTLTEPLPLPLLKAPLAGPTGMVLGCARHPTAGALKLPKAVSPPSPPTEPRVEPAEICPCASPSLTCGPARSPNGEKLMFTFGSNARKPCCKSSCCLPPDGSNGVSSLMPPSDARADPPPTGATGILSSMGELLKKRANRELPGNADSSSSGSSLTNPFSKSSKLPIIDHGSDSLPVGWPDSKLLPRARSMARIPATPPPMGPIPAAPTTPMPTAEPQSLAMSMDSATGGGGPGARREGASTGGGGTGIASGGITSWGGGGTAIVLAATVTTAGVQTGSEAAFGAADAAIGVAALGGAAWLPPSHPAFRSAPRSETLEIETLAGSRAARSLDALRLTMSSFRGASSFSSCMPSALPPGCSGPGGGLGNPKEALSVRPSRTTLSTARTACSASSRVAYVMQQRKLGGPLVAAEPAGLTWMRMILPYWPK
mmetsp:Transcript_27195/g.54729  ORF Transcript_27195/g.54729 Transcript_27195/m.54729 type:complete len:504 (-) Transcript_27195:269-1780(-)